MPPKAGTKRKASSKTDGDSKAKQPKQDGQRAVVRKDLNIPLDEGFSGPANTVYVDDDGIIYDASLNQTNIGDNANKVASGQSPTLIRIFGSLTVIVLPPATTPRWGQEDAQVLRAHSLGSCWRVWPSRSIRDALAAASLD